jgi:hypothetical protein
VCVSLHEITNSSSALLQQRHWALAEWNYKLINSKTQRDFYFQLSAPRADTLTFMLARQLSIRAIHCILGCPTDTLTFALLSLIFLPSLARTTLGSAGVIIAQPVT